MSDENGNFIPDRAGSTRNKMKEEDDDFLEEALNEVLGGAQAPVGGETSNGARSRPRSKLKKSEDDQILDETLDEILGEVTKDERKYTGSHQGTKSQSRHQQSERDRRRYPSEREFFENNFDDAEGTEAGAGISRPNPSRAKPENCNSGIAALNPGKFFKGLNGKLPDDPSEFGKQMTSLALGLCADHDEVEAELDEFVKVTNSDKRDDPEIQESLRRLSYENDFRHQQPPGDAVKRIGSQERGDMFGRGQNIAAQRRNMMDPFRMLGQGQRRRNNPNVEDGDGLGGNHARNQLNDVLGGQAVENGERQAENRPDPFDFPAQAKSMLGNAGNGENAAGCGGNVFGKLNFSGGARNEEDFWSLLKPDKGGPMKMLQNYKALTENGQKTPHDLLGELGGRGGDGGDGNLHLGSDNGGGCIEGIGEGNGGSLAVENQPLNQLSQVMRLGGGSSPMIPRGMIPGSLAPGGSRNGGGALNPMLQLIGTQGGNGGGGDLAAVRPAFNQLSQLMAMGGGGNPMIPDGMIPGSLAPDGMRTGGAGAQGQLPGDDIDPDNASFGDILNQLLGLEVMRAENNQCPQSDGMNTVIILDCSASMSGEPFQQAQKFVHNFLSELEVIQFEYGIEENVALITVGEQLSVMQHLTTDYSLVRQQCDCMLTEGPTKLHLALPLPKAVLSHRTLGQNLVRGLCKIHDHIVCPRVILISDGWPTEIVEHEHLAPTTDQNSLLLQNICFDLLGYTTTENMVTMYCYPVGNANQGLLEMLSETTGGRILEASDAERLSRHFLHHNLCGPLRKSGINLADKSRVTEEVKKSLVISDDTDVDEVMKILNQPEPDIQRRNEEIMKKLKKLQDSNGKPQKVERGGQGFLGGMGQPMQGIRGQRPMMRPQMGGPVEGQPPKEKMGLEDAWQQINNVFQGKLPQQGGLMQGQPVRAPMGLRPQLFQQGQGNQLPFGSEIGQLPNFMGQQEGRQPNIAELLGQHQPQGQGGQGDPLGFGLFGQQGQGFGGQGQPQNPPAFGQFDGPSEEANIIAMLNHYDQRADQRSREEPGNLVQDGQQRPVLPRNRLREAQSQNEHEVKERQKPLEFDGFGSEDSLAAMLGGIGGGVGGAKHREGPRLRRDMNEEEEDIIEDHSGVVGKANDGDLDVMLNDILGLGEPNVDVNQDRGFQMPGLPQRWGQNDNDMGQRLNIPNLMRNMESSFNSDSFMRRGQGDSRSGARWQEDSNEEMDITEDEHNRGRRPAARGENPASGHAVNRAYMDKARPDGQGVKGPPLPRGRGGTD